MKSKSEVKNDYYTIQNFPTFVAHNGNWDIYADAKGHCAAIPVEEGCNASGFGDWNYTRCTLSLYGVSLPATFAEFVGAGSQRASEQKGQQRLSNRRDL